MKKILVMIDAERGQHARLTVSFDLTRALNGRLDCLDVSACEDADPCEPAPGDTKAVTVPTEAQTVTDARYRVDHAGVDFRWIKGCVERDAELADATAAVDLVVLGSPEGMGFNADKLIGKALTQWHKSVVVVPPDAPGFRVKGEAVILWDGSDEASAAMRAALPLLRQATTVTLVEINDGSLKMRARDAAAYLSQRDIDARIVTDLPFGQNAADVLVEQTRLLRPDYIVMGGFGRPRFIEGIFGGVTHRLLGEAHVPLFLRH